MATQVMVPFPPLSGPSTVGGHWVIDYEWRRDTIDGEVIDVVPEERRLG